MTHIYICNRLYYKLNILMKGNTMKLIIKINLDNAAFDINDNATEGEVRRLLN